MGKTELRSAAGSSEKLNVSEFEQLITKVCTNFVNQLEIKIDKKFSELNEKLNDFSNTLKNLNEDICESKKAIKSIQSKCDYLEQFIKRNTLQFHGLEEGVNENSVTVLVDYINNQLKVQCAKNDIDSLFRVGKKDNAKKPRAITVTFVSNDKRNEIFSAKRFSKNSNVVIYEDLTKKRYELLLLAKEKYGKREAWSMGGKIYALRGGRKCLINSVDDL